MLDLLLMAVAGVAAGVATGLLPGIHPNTISSLLVSLSPILLAMVSPHAAITFIVAMSIANSFLGFVPGVFLGMPEGETALSLLPGHQLLLQGRGYEAVALTVLGGVGVVLLSVLLLPLLLVILPVLYAHVRPFIGILLVAVAALMVLTERAKFRALAVFFLAGLLGVAVFSFYSVDAMLFPLFTGLFGISTLLMSSASGVAPPLQSREMDPLGRRAPVGVLKGFAAGLVVGILPGIGPSQAGVVVSELTSRRDPREFLVALGGISAVSALFSLLALYLIRRPRSGAAVAVERVFGALGFPELLLLIATAIFSAGLGALLTLKLTGSFAGLIARVDYRKLNNAIILFLIVMTVVLSGPLGLLVLITATAIGLLPPLWGVKRTQGMGALMLPLVFFYFGLGF